MLTEELRRLDLLIKEILKTGRPLNPENPPNYDLLRHFMLKLHRIEMVEVIPSARWSDYTRSVARLEGACGLRNGSSPNVWVDLEIIRLAVEEAIAAPVPVASSRFPKSRDKALTDILERDLTEAEACIKAGLWKSSMLLCGSILEAALYEYLRRDSTWTMDATKRKAIPHRTDKATKTKMPKDIRSKEEEEKWTLDDLIKFACSNGVLDMDEGMLHTGIRDARNMIHPNAELRKVSSVDDKSAAVSMAILQQALDKLGKQKDPPL